MYQFGMRIANALNAHLHEFIDCEFQVLLAYDDVEPVNKVIRQFNPDVILYSYGTLPLPVGHKVDKYDGRIHIGVSHEQEQCLVGAKVPNDWYGGVAFKYWIGHDPTIKIEGHENLFNATRPILRSEYKSPPNQNIFGTSSFGFPNKGHVRTVLAIQNEFDEAVLRFNMPPSVFIDPHCQIAKKVAEACRSVIYKPGIKLEVTHTMFETEEELVEWMYGNDYHIYDYDQGVLNIS